MDFDFKKLSEQEKKILIIFSLMAIFLFLLMIVYIFHEEFNPIAIFVNIFIFNVFIGGIGLLYYSINKKKTIARKLEEQGKYLDAMKIYKDLQMFENARVCWDIHVKKKKDEALLAEQDGFLEEALKIYREIESREDAERVEEKIFKISDNEKIIKAKKFESEGKLEYAQVIYQDLGNMDEVHRLEKLKKIRHARILEEKKEYREAARLYEALGMWEKAKECMKKSQE